MAEIDIARVLAEKAPSLARHLPGFALRWLRRTIHEEDINYILRTFWELPPREFIHACFRTWGVTYSSDCLLYTSPTPRGATSSSRTTPSAAWTA